MGAVCMALESIHLQPLAMSLSLRKLCSDLTRRTLSLFPLLRERECIRLLPLRARGCLLFWLRGWQQVITIKPVLKTLLPLQSLKRIPLLPLTMTLEQLNLLPLLSHLIRKNGICLLSLFIAIFHYTVNSLVTHTPRFLLWGMGFEGVWGTWEISGKGSIKWELRSIYSPLLFMTETVGQFSIFHTLCLHHLGHPSEQVQHHFQLVYNG